jgi:hypothetical protein
MVEYFKQVERREYTFGSVPRGLPKKGRVIVHNRVRPTAPHFPGIPETDWDRDMIGAGYMPGHGWNGYRVWTQKADLKGLEVCDCGACGGLKHYRFRNSTVGKSEQYTPAQVRRAEAR